MKRYISLFVILILISLSLSGCYDAKSIENFAYVIAVGIDTGTTNTLKLTFQFAVPNNSASNDESGQGSTQSSDSSILSVECSSIDSGISLINGHISKKVNLSHCKAVIMSEALSSGGVSDYVKTLMNNIEIRPDTNIIISKCSASDFLQNSKPPLEDLSAKYYEIILNSSEYTGYSGNVTLSGFYSNMADNSSEAYASLGDINPDTKSVSNIGTAVFKGDTFVGELDSIETICHLIITKNINTATISIPSPFDNKNTIALSISMSRKTKASVEFTNGLPYIKLDVSIEANILSMNGNVDYTNSDNLKLIEESANAYLYTNINAYLYKTSKDFKSDISGFRQICEKILFYYR
ncbi:MAG: Ger(x)C family spore germination protein [Firmicutes bacterium]|nr:Ger(x)C family spore germination protein [Bacillota bacterium]